MLGNHLKIIKYLRFVFNASTVVVNKFPVRIITNQVVNIYERLNIYIVNLCSASSFMWVFTENSGVTRKIISS